MELCFHLVAENRYCYLKRMDREQLVFFVVSLVLVLAKQSAPVYLTTPPQNKEEVSCAMCQFLVAQVQSFVETKGNPEIVSLLEDSCNIWTDSEWVDQCKQAVKNFVPVILQKVEQEIDAETICASIGLCSSSISTETLDSLEKFAHASIARRLSVNFPELEHFMENHRGKANHFDSPARRQMKLKQERTLEKMKEKKAKKSESRPDPKQMEFTVTDVTLERDVLSAKSVKSPIGTHHPVIQKLIEEVADKK